MISILIITYGREEELLSTLSDISLYNNSDLELLILDNNDNNHLEFKIKKTLNNIKFNYSYFNDGINYGVAKGRNYLIKKAKGEIFITLDDDVEVADINNTVFKVKEYYKNDPSIGCLAFKIINYYTKKQLRHEIPHGNKKLDFNKNLETYYFIGAGHAILKKTYDEIGIYPDDLGLYGGEELDLSFRIIKSSKKIIYTADIEVYHKVSPNGRMSASEEKYLRMLNRLKVAYKYLPNKYFLSNLLIWYIYYTAKEKKIKNFLKLIKEIRKRERNILKKEEIEVLKKLKARLLY